VWLCIEVAGYKIINAYKPPHSRFTPTAILMFPHPRVCTLVTSTANTSTGVTTKHLLMVRAWTPGQYPTTLDCCITQRKQPASLPMERQHQPRPGLHKFGPGQPTARQTCSRKVPEVRTSVARCWLKNSPMSSQSKPKTSSNYSKLDHITA